MAEERKKVARQGMGLMPFFHDHSVYDGLKLMAGHQKKRLSTMILDIVKEFYYNQNKQVLNTEDAKVFHDQIEAVCNKTRVVGLADYIEYACSKYMENAVRELQPKIKRG